MRERGALPKEEDDAVREENFLSSWLREDGREKEERIAKVGEENEEERGEKRKRDEEKEENQMGTVKKEGVTVLFRWVETWRLVVVFVGETSWRSLKNSSDCELDTRSHVRVVPDVTDVLVSPSSVVTEFCDGFSCYSDWEDVVPQSFSFSIKRAHCCTSTERYESSQVKPHPLSRRRMMPIAPLQNSNDTFKKSSGFSWWNVRCGVREKERSSQERNSIWKKITV